MKGATRALLAVAMTATTVAWAYEPPWGFIWKRGQGCDFGTSIQDQGYPSGWVKYTRTSDEEWWMTTLLDTNEVGYWVYHFTTGNCPPSGYTYEITGYIGGPICERTIYLGGGSRYDIQLHPAPGGK